MIHAQAYKRSQLIASQVFTAGGTVAGTLDCVDADYAVITMNFSAESTTDGDGPSIALSEGDTTVVSNMVTFDADFARSTEDLTTAKNVVYQVNTKGRKRYLYLLLTAGADTDGDLITAGATAELSRLGQAGGTLVASGDVNVIG